MDRIFSRDGLKEKLYFSHFFTNVFIMVFSDLLPSLGIRLRESLYSKSMAEAYVEQTGDPMQGRKLGGNVRMAW